ncbi:MAG: MFS transporter, partial [Acidimicrobiales bacterium]
LQGLGGGGLLVGAQAVIADIVPPRDRGRYAGFFGATFGAATVLGPLLGGIIVEYWSWRWIFFINVPLGVVALMVTAAALPSAGQRVSHSIDYAGIATLTVGASCLILFTSLGGVTIAWSSPTSIALLAVGVVVTVAFALVERRSSEPILAPRLFRNRVFLSGSAIGFVVGFAMFGAMIFLPLFFQEVRGVTPTMSGVRLLPMMVGLFGASIITGQLVSKGWRYRPFPIAGCAVMTIGLGLMGLVGEQTSSVTMAVFMFVLGAGIGLVMQILVTAVQNSVGHTDVGAATAGANFFRSIGGSFGTAVFGALYANEEPRAIAHGMAAQHLTYRLTPSSFTPAGLHKLPAPVLHVVLAAITTSIQHIYRVATPIGVIAVLVALTLPEIKLRASLHPVADEVPLSSADPLVG